jgi:hypothetical protein
MKNYVIPLLLHLSLHTFTAAEVHTFIQGDPNSYIGDASKIPELGPDDIEVKDDGDLFFAFGAEISKRLFEAAEKHCKDPESDQCKTKTQEIMGIGPSNNGVQKRAIGLLVAGAPILAMGAWKAFTYIWDRLNKSTRQAEMHMKIPKKQKEEVAKWDVANEDKFLYKPENKDPVEVSINDDKPTSLKPVEIKKEGDGNIAIVLPDEIIPAIEEGWNDVRCGQFPMKRSLRKRFTMQVSSRSTFAARSIFLVRV